MYENPSTAEEGVYYIVSTTLDNCSDTAEVNVLVNSLPMIEVSVPANICYQEENVTIQVQPMGGTITGLGVAGNQFNPKDINLVIDQGSYVFYNYSDANSCTNRDSVLITLRT